MRRLFLTLACMVLLQAQASILPDLRILNHLAIGAEIGTPGWSVDQLRIVWMQQPSLSMSWK